VAAPDARRVRLLWHEFTISTPSPAVLAALEFLVQAAAQRVDVRDEIAIAVVPAAGGFEIHQDRGPIVDAADASAVLDVVYRRVYQHVFDEASRQGWVRAHAALADVHGRRFVLAGAAGVGKTTLALRLLYDGEDVQGDESVLLRAGESIAVPRPFHLKPGSEAYVPEITELLPHLPTVAGDPPVSAFDPTRAGLRWEITPGTVDAVVVLEHADSTSLDHVGSTAVMHEIVEQVFLRHEPKATVVREIASVLREAPCYRLRIGDPAQASALVRELAGSSDVGA
jgi:hypothetical protein